MLCFNNNINHNFSKLKHKIFQEFKCAGAVAFLHACIVIFSNLIVAYCFLLVMRLDEGHWKGATPARILYPTNAHT